MTENPDENKARQKRAAIIFLSMQAFFVIFGFGLYYSLKELKLYLRDSAGEGGQCAPALWVGKAPDEAALNDLGRPFRIIGEGEAPPPKTLYLYTGTDGTVERAECR